MELQRVGHNLVTKQQPRWPGATWMKGCRLLRRMQRSRLHCLVKNALQTNSVSPKCMGDGDPSREEAKRGIRSCYEVRGPKQPGFINILTFLSTSSESLPATLASLQSLTCAWAVSPWTLALCSLLGWSCPRYLHGLTPHCLQVYAQMSLLSVRLSLANLFKVKHSLAPVLLYFPRCHLS